MILDPISTFSRIAVFKVFTVLKSGIRILHKVFKKFSLSTPHFSRSPQQGDLCSGCPLFHFFSGSGQVEKESRYSV